VHARGRVDDHELRDKQVARAARALRRYVECVERVLYIECVLYIDCAGVAQVPSAESAAIE